jgi:hypothetical protein
MNPTSKKSSPIEQLSLFLTDESSPANTAAEILSVQLDELKLTGVF